MLERVRRRSNQLLSEFLSVGEMCPLGVEMDSDALLAYLMPAGLWGLYQQGVMFPPMPWWGPRKEPESAQAGAASSSASASTTPPKPVASRVNPFLWSSPPEQVRLIRKRCNKSPEPVMKRKLILEYLHLPPMEEIRDGIEELEKTLNLRVVLKATAGAAAEAAAEDPPEPPAPAEAAGAVGTGSTDGHIKSLDTFGIGPGAAAGALADHVNDPDWAPAVGTTDVGSTDVALCAQPLVTITRHSIVDVAPQALAIRKGVELLYHTFQQQTLRQEMGLGRLEFGFPFLTSPRSSASVHKTPKKTAALAPAPAPEPVPRIQEIHDDDPQDCPLHDSGIIEDISDGPPTRVSSDDIREVVPCNFGELPAQPPFIRIEELDDDAEEPSMHDSGIVLVIDQDEITVNGHPGEALPESGRSVLISNVGSKTAGPENMVRDMVLVGQTPLKSIEDLRQRMESSVAELAKMIVEEASSLPEPSPVKDTLPAAEISVQTDDDELYAPPPAIPAESTESKVTLYCPPSPCPSGKAVMAGDATPPLQVLHQQTDELQSTLDSLITAPESKGKLNLIAQAIKDLSPSGSEPTSPEARPISPPASPARKVEENTGLVVARQPKPKPLMVDSSTWCADSDMFDHHPFLHRPLTPASSIRSLNRWSSFTRDSFETGMTTPPQSRPGSSANFTTPIAGQKMLPWNDDDSASISDTPLSRRRSNSSRNLTPAQKRGQLLHSATIERMEQIDRPLTRRTSSLAERSRNKIQTPIILPPTEPLSAESTEIPRQFPFPDICYVSDASTQTPSRAEVREHSKRQRSIHRAASTSAMDVKSDHELDGIKELFEELAEVEHDIQRVALGQEPMVLPDMELTLTDIKEGLPAPERLEQQKKRERLMKRLRERARTLKTKVVDSVRKNPTSKPEKGDKALLAPPLS